MVAAGVYLLARSHELLAGWPLEVAGWVGGITAVAGAFIALGQVDLKRLLAGSTTSQLGLMFVGVAAGGPAVAVFHLVAHAAGKAGLFLAAGVFQHARGTTDLARLRGAGRDDRAAFAGFTINALSIAAVPPLAAFWSKDSIAAAAQPHTAWFVLVLMAAAGSAAYLLRPWLILAAHEPGRAASRGRVAMLAGVAATAAASLTLGLAGDPLVSILDADELPATSASVVLSLLAVAAGATAVLLRPRIPRRLVAAAREQLYADVLIRDVVQQPVMAAARLARAFDERVLDAAVDGLGRAGLALARTQDWIERHVIDAAVDGLAHRTQTAGAELRRLQSGRLFEYLRDAVLGAAAVAVLVALSALL
jgi:NADH-quinone oxidoreductase subunit L